MVDERTVWLSALLHDVGKLWENVLPAPADLPLEYRQQAQYQHEPFSAWFVRQYASRWTQDEQAVVQMVLKHHRAALRDELMVQIADWLASYEREEAETPEQGGRGKAQTVLCSILSRLERHPAPTMQYYALRPLQLDRETLFPQPNATTSAQQYTQMWQKFVHELQRIPSPEARTLQALLYKYLWCAPSDRSYQTIPDVSLYSHLVSAAAIASCLTRAQLSETDLQTLRDALQQLNRTRNEASLSPSHRQAVQRPLALLVKGDISGTQQFLYLLTSSGAARGLRGRSFYLQLLTEAIADWILRRLNLPGTSCLYVGGGHFYLLVPSADEPHLPELARQVAQKLWDAHQGDLSLNLGWVAVAPLDFISREQGGRGFADKWGEVSAQIQQRKDRRWMEMGVEAMAQRLFTPRQTGTTAEQMCQVCHGEWQQGVDRMDEGVRKCRRCYAFEELGRQLRDPEYLVQFVVDEQPAPVRATWQDVLRMFGLDTHILAKDERVSAPAGASRAVLQRIDNTDFLCDHALELGAEWKMPVAYDFRLLADATPTRDEAGTQVADFDHLAESAEGVHWLGVLRMDVDDLGDLFRHGLGESATLSRMATLSQSLRLFFEAWVPHICREQNKKPANPQGEGKVYLLYAGGDDLFIVGAWSTLPYLAERIRQEFRQYAGGDHVTVSAGIAVEHEKHPLYRLAEEAKHALDDRAKEHRQNGKHKDAICFLQETMGWEHFARVKEWKDRLVKMLQPEGGGEKVPRALLTRLMEISSLYRANLAVQRRRLRNGEIDEKQFRELVAHDRWRWRLIYHLSRFAQRHQSQQENLKTLQEALLQKDLITSVHVAARWAELLTREER